MRDLIGLKWGDLTENEKNKLYIIANVDIDNVDVYSGECIVDFTENLAIKGIVTYGEEQSIYIYVNSIFYNPIA